MNHLNEPAVLIERCSSSRGEIQLQRRGEYYEVISNGTFLMATYNGESERLLVKAALDRCQSPQYVLIGGLGVGFSLQEVLKDERLKQVTVVEIDENVIKWNSSWLAKSNHNATGDARCHLIHADMITWMKETTMKFDLICLDIDNGPDWVVYDENCSLYNQAGLQTLQSLMRPGGCITFWSATASPEFVLLLRSFFGKDAVEVTEVTQQRGEPDYIFIVNPS
ncbi:spermidine synthase [Paenibacillus turicensis]|uniref:Spermidine synthase n=1 Tax=Paenibacillus turicensis TaxID=160487 RepID=A0ABS4FMV6_9BACL|nr:spermine/spermidine synthase [Paenibacillus turicensis]MBP1903917.1 spermidine synthase [Paenibacillus turicensis]